MHQLSRHPPKSTGYLHVAPDRQGSFLAICILLRSLHLLVHLHLGEMAGTHPSAASLHEQLIDKLPCPARSSLAAFLLHKGCSFALCRAVPSNATGIPFLGPVALWCRLLSTAPKYRSPYTTVRVSDNGNREDIGILSVSVFLFGVVYSLGYLYRFRFMI